MADRPDRTRLAALFDNSPDAIVVVDEAGTVVRANDRVEPLFGYDPAELEGEPVEVLVPEAARAAHPAQRESYTADPSTRPMGAGLDLRARRRDGSTVPVDISLSPIETDDGLEVMAAVRDITERETLRRKYRTVLETAPDAMFLADAETGELLEVNRRATDLVGASEDALLGRDQTALHPDEDAERYRDLFRRHAAAEGVDTVARFPEGDELSVETANGERVPVEISVQSTELVGRNVVIGVFRDVSDRREYEAELHRQIERLEALANVLSHDLRNPLNVAEGNVSLAKETGDLDRLDAVEAAHARMERLITDSLTLIREGYEVESTEPVEFDSLLADCWASVRTSAATLDVVGDGLVYADSLRIESLFENLFRNAVEHGGEAVSVRAGVYDGGFFVADDGPGIPEADRESVLEPGWTTSADGTGLGLNIVSEIASAHDWRVRVGESRDGGARLDFTGVRTAPYDDAFGTDRPSRPAGSSDAPE